MPKTAAADFEFEIVAHPATQRPETRRAALETRSLPESLTDPWVAAAHYVPSDDLLVAINTALALGAPLLLTGEPGTGKTQVGWYLARYFGLERDAGFFPFTVRSSTTWRDLLYDFDAVAYFHAAHGPKRACEPIDRQPYVHHGPLWKALDHPGTSVLLIDEIDKAPRDFPNDLLEALDQHAFDVPELETRVEPTGVHRPVVIITSNSERRLPEPFLRRCIFHHLQFTRALAEQAVAVRRENDQFPGLDPVIETAAIDRFMELRNIEYLRKKPCTAELLAWLVALSLQSDLTADALRHCRLDALPLRSVLIKDREDLESLR